MHTFWTPANKPPALDTTTGNIVLEEALDTGIIPLARKAWDDLLESEPLGRYIDELGDNLHRTGTGGLDMFGGEHHYWQKGVLKTGAALTLLAYKRAGYFYEVDEQAVQTGQLLAEMGGIPDSYAVSASDDVVLTQLISIVADSRVLHDSVISATDGAYKQHLTTGAGLSRLCLQQSVLA